MNCIAMHTKFAMHTPSHRSRPVWPLSSIRTPSHDGHKVLSSVPGTGLHHRTGAPSSFLFLAVRPGAPSRVLAPSSDASIYTSQTQGLLIPSSGLYLNLAFKQHQPTLIGSRRLVSAQQGPWVAICQDL